MTPTEARPRRDVLKCMAWAGTGMVWTLAGGVPRSHLLGAAEAAEEGLSFVQISDSHLGFSGPPNTDTPGTLGEAIAAVNRLKGNARFLLHTGDVSHLSRAAQFDTAEQIIRGAGLETHYVPGEHDVLVDQGKPFFARFTKGAASGGWYSFDEAGVHFVALNNVVDLQSGGMGNLGAEQLDWLKRDLDGRPASQPVVVFAHIPLWAVYAPWGWGTEDAAEALRLLRPFGLVTVLNGHIHQVMQKVEGQVAFHTARSTAFPQPSPGAPEGPGPMKSVPPGQLRTLLGVTTVRQVSTATPLAIVDSPLVA